MYVPPNLNNQANPFSCPNCQGLIRRHAFVASTNIHNTNPLTGDDDGLFDTNGNEEPNDGEWVCYGPKGEGQSVCDWRGDVEVN
jgi:hypothetical protein